MKIFAAGLATETNTFCPRLTSKKNFQEEYFTRNGNHSNPPHAWAVPLAVFAKRSKKRKWNYTEGLFAAAQPAGLIIKKDYEELRDCIINDLMQAMPVDMVLLNLHGAMVAQDYDDCEGDILKRVRDIVGKNIPVGILLDPHANLSQDMLDYADVLVCYKEYPHTDVEEAAEHLFTLMEGMLDKNICPAMAAFDCQVINSYPTMLEPMKSYMDQVKKLEQQNGILSISIVHGFPWSDVADAGSKIIVITDNQPEKSKELAEKLGIKLFDLRGKTMPMFYSIEDALKLASESHSFPVVLADFADNTGGGAAGDSTFILQSLLEKNIKNVALGVIWDPIAVEIASTAGVGNHLPLRIGGKIGPYSGNPIDLNVEVTAVNPDLAIHFGNGLAHYGRAVAIRANGIDIVLASLRLQVYSTECFTEMGIDLENKFIIVVKSSEHFRASFSKISKNILSVSTAGTLCPDFSKIPYKKIKRRLWPLDKTITLMNSKMTEEV